MNPATIEELLRIVRDAGSRIMSIYNSVGVATNFKADASPVTEADLASNDILVKGLGKLDRRAAMISEESLPTNAAEIVREAERCWLVDPLDGTRDFLARSGDFTVNVAYMERGQPIVGVVLAPVTGALYFAAHGVGAFRVTGATKSSLKTRPMDRQVFSALISNMHGRGEDERLKQAYPNAMMKRVGSSLKYVVIADGQADVSIRFSPTSLWDTAAAQCVLELAGGAIVDFSGRPLTYDRGQLINPPFLAVGDRAVDVASFLKPLTDDGSHR